MLPVVIVTILFVTPIVSETHAIAHPLNVHVTVYVPALFTVMPDVVAPFDHTYVLAPLAVSVTHAVVHVNVFVFGTLLIVTAGVIVYTALVCIVCTFPTASVERKHTFFPPAPLIANGAL